MHTIKIKIHDKAYKHFIWLLSKFSKDEIEVITEDSSYLKIKAELQAELDEINEGKAEYYTLDELDDRLEKKLKKHEGHL
ncbi:tRNA pseudouridine synthase A [Carboxylicivirga sp. M1479]|uniref:tRNA pseudouridine synthase A n=1 Tax=Carboxylicivirga sp. M1479 TaxID=2594476 RepID=UPI00117817C3|nr:tRNA pseudouridine synthase A [Carboxylicivirga sp. M1479]TRX70536.1 tRNA pseudouridine synthase A [Carboxylicivirga sp. M1479]